MTGMCCQSEPYLAVVARDESNTGALHPVDVPQCAASRAHNALHIQNNNVSLPSGRSHNALLIHNNNVIPVSGRTNNMPERHKIENLVPSRTFS